MDEIVARYLHNLIARVDGPMHLRLLLQPTMAIVLAARAGLRDARSGAAPYFWSLFTSAGHRAEMLQQGWKDVGKVFLVALALDVVYQLITVRWIYPLESITVAVMLAFLPYLLFRGAITRLAGAGGAKPKPGRSRAA